MAFITDSQIFGVTVALLVIYGSMFLLWRLQCSKCLNLPPGPRALPIVVSLHLLSTHPHRSLAELASQYGPLMSVWLGQRLCIVASTAEAAKEFLKLQDANFAGRPLTRAAEIVAFGDMVFNEITPPVRHLQKIFVTKLMSTRQLESSGYIQTEEMAFKLCKLANENGPSCVNMHIIFMNTNVLSRMIFNKLSLGIREQDHGIEVIKDLLGAGSDTTTVTTEHAMTEVLHNPTILTKVTSELDLMWLA